MKAIYIEVWRINFGDPDRSHCSDLIAVTNADYLPHAIEQKQRWLAKSNSLIDGSIV